jgi:tetratricopeptide (TPR) repeat protein
MVSRGIVVRRVSRVLVVMTLGFGLVLPGAAMAESLQKVEVPRFFVPDFRSSDGGDETSWVALAVSECLRERLRRSTLTTAVSEMRTAGVLSRWSGTAGPTVEEAVRTAAFLGADFAVTAQVGKAEGGYAGQIQLHPAKAGAQAASKPLQGRSVRVLLDAATRAVLDMSGVQPTDAQRQRIAAIPHGSDSAIEYYAKAIRALRAGKPTDSLHYISESIQYDNSFSPSIKLLGQMNFAARNDRETLAIYERLLRQAKVEENPVDEIFAMTQIGIAHQRRSELDVAEKYYQVALQKAAQIGLSDQETLVLGALASLRVDQKKRDEAMALLRQRLAMLEAQGDRLALGPACMTLALVHSAKNEIPQALDLLKRAAQYADEVGLPSDKATALFQIGEIYKEQGRFDEALQAYDQSLKFSDELEAGSACRQIAEIYEKQGKFDEALAMLRKAEAVLSKRKAYVQQSNCLARIARLLVKQGNSAKGVETMAEAVEILRDLKHPDLATYEKELTEMRAQAKPK